MSTSTKTVSKGEVNIVSMRKS